ncbi:MAG: hypothetical protein ACLRX6_03445 [Limosilactobacillus pontis]|uniref:hypothetical protein n=1 Tax=Limosilactobacillus pontis TaxID=35787 RepID=UPI0039A3717F
MNSKKTTGEYLRILTAEDPYVVVFCDQDGTVDGTAKPMGSKCSQLKTYTVGFEEYFATDKKQCIFHVKAENKGKAMKVIWNIRQELRKMWEAE